MLWRAWHHRNNIVHGDGKASVDASVLYLINYEASYASPSMIQTDMKGKRVICQSPLLLLWVNQQNQYGNLHQQDGPR
jgi:hypothetical protein